MDDPFDNQEQQRGNPQALHFRGYIDISNPSFLHENAPEMLTSSIEIAFGVVCMSKSFRSAPWCMYNA